MTIVVLAVTMLLSAPLFYKVVDSSRVTAHTNKLVAALRYARAKAVMRAQPVSVCSSDDGLRCTDTPWEHGYIVFVDNASAGIVDSSDQVLNRWVAQTPKVTITLTGRSYIRFHPIGGLLARSLNNDAERRGEYLSLLADWLPRLSLVSTAHAGTEVESVHNDAQPIGGSSLSGVFTVCAMRVGRLINVSLQGHISTEVAGCFGDRT